MKSISEAFEILSNVFVFEYILHLKVFVFESLKSNCIYIHFNVFDPMSGMLFFLSAVNIINVTIMS